MNKYLQFFFIAVSGIIAAGVIARGSPQTSDVDLLAAQVAYIPLESNVKTPTVGRVVTSTLSGTLPATISGIAYIDISGVTVLQGQSGDGGDNVPPGPLSPPAAVVSLTGTTIANWPIQNFTSIQGGNAFCDTTNTGGGDATMTLSGLTADPQLKIQSIIAGQGDNGNPSSFGGSHNSGAASLSISGSFTTLDLSSLQLIQAQVMDPNWGSGVNATVTIAASELTSLDLSGLTTMYSGQTEGSCHFSCNGSPALTDVAVAGEINFPASNWGYFSITGAALDVTTVNAILISIAAGGGYSAQVDLSGGTSSAPTDDGATAATTIAANGGIVTTN